LFQFRNDDKFVSTDTELANKVIRADLDLIDQYRLQAGTLFEKIQATDFAADRIAKLTAFLNNEPDQKNMLAQLTGHLVGSVQGSNSVLDVSYTENNVVYAIRTLVHVLGRKIKIFCVHDELESEPISLDLKRLDQQLADIFFPSAISKDNGNDVGFEAFHIFKQNGWKVYAKESSLNKLKLPVEEANKARLSTNFKFQPFFVNFKHFLPMFFHKNSEIEGEIAGDEHVFRAEIMKQCTDLNLAHFIDCDEALANFYEAAFSRY